MPARPAGGGATVVHTVQPGSFSTDDAFSTDGSGGGHFCRM